jgi:5-methylcytosine-specific restriction endonuclease McrA
MPKDNLGLPNISKVILGTSERKGRGSTHKAVRDQVWDKYIGVKNIEGKCYCCGLTINYRTFEVGHNKAVAKGGKDNISNLRPICRPCNSSMGTMSIEQYKRKYYGKPSKPKKGTKTKTKPRKRKSPNVLKMPKLKFPDLL